MANALERLHCDDSAQVSFLAVAAAVCFVALLAMVMNSNDIVRERMRVQEVADVTALSAATWQARGLNMISMINVLNSKILSMTVLVNSLNKTLPIVVTVAEVQETAFQACSAVPFVGPFCAVMATTMRRTSFLSSSVAKPAWRSTSWFTLHCKGGWVLSCTPCRSKPKHPTSPD